MHHVKGRGAGVTVLAYRKLPIMSSSFTHVRELGNDTSSFPMPTSTILPPGMAAFTAVCASPITLRP